MVVFQLYLKAIKLAFLLFDFLCYCDIIILIITGCKSCLREWAHPTLNLFKLVWIIGYISFAITKNRYNFMEVILWVEKTLLRLLRNIVSP